jgi:quinol monooxygenase YgiN
MSLSGENVVVIADIHAKPGQEGELLKTLETAAQEARAKDGCLLYRLHQDIAEPAHVVLYEVWRDKAAVDAHHASEQFNALIAASTPIAERASICRFRTVPE